VVCGCVIGENGRSRSSSLNNPETHQYKASPERKHLEKVIRKIPIAGKAYTCGGMKRGTQKLGGGCYDPTRPWPENLSRVSLPVCERVAQQLVSLVRLDRASEQFVRSCGQALRKVATALVPQPHSSALAAETVRRQ
jgi:hypothetical protein